MWGVGYLPRQANPDWNLLWIEKNNQPIACIQVSIACKSRLTWTLARLPQELTNYMVRVLGTIIYCYCNNLRG